MLESRQRATGNSVATSSGADANIRNAHPLRLVETAGAIPKSISIRAPSGRTMQVPPCRSPGTSAVELAPSSMNDTARHAVIRSVSTVRRRGLAWHIVPTGCAVEPFHHEEARLCGPRGCGGARSCARAFASREDRRGCRSCSGLREPEVARLFTIVSRNISMERQAGWRSRQH